MTVSKNYFPIIIMPSILQTGGPNSIKGHITLTGRQNQTLMPINPDDFLFSLQNWNNGV
jgi:hypothetical protein